MVTKAAAQPPLLGLVALSSFAHEFAATSIRFTVHKLCNQLVCSLPLNPKLCAQSFSTIIIVCNIHFVKGQVLFGRHLNRQRSNLLLGCLGSHGRGVRRSQGQRN
jgi:hypothetical protein